eukprot:8302088-Pyramimonas_sp.AAC.1
MAPLKDLGGGKRTSEKHPQETKTTGQSEPSETIDLSRAACTSGASSSSLRRRSCTARNCPVSPPPLVGGGRARRQRNRLRGAKEETSRLLLGRKVELPSSKPRRGGRT